MPSVLGKGEIMEKKFGGTENSEARTADFHEENSEARAEDIREEGSGDLTREEILARAKRENKDGDERQRSQMQWGNYAGFIAMEFACVVIMFTQIFLRDKFRPEFFCIMFTGVAAQNIVQACVNKNKKTKTVFIVCAALITAATVLYWAFWVLGLCGIDL